MIWLSARSATSRSSLEIHRSTSQREPAAEMALKGGGCKGQHGHITKIAPKTVKQSETVTFDEPPRRNVSDIGTTRKYNRSQITTKSNQSLERKEITSFSVRVRVSQRFDFIW